MSEKKPKPSTCMGIFTTPPVAILSHIEMIAFDIGGVLAVIDKEPLKKLLGRNETAERVFFDEDFFLFQTGFYSPIQFLNKNEQKLNIPSDDLFFAMKGMMVLNDLVELIEKVRVPYIFASNINEIHLASFMEQSGQKGSVIDDSIFSFRINALKPQESFFSILLCRHKYPPERVLFIDDQHQNIQTARRLGITAIPCQTPGHLKEILKPWLH